MRNRRDVLTLLAGATAAWPLAALAQQGGKKIRVGVLMNFAAGQAEGQARFAAFAQGMAQHGWIIGRNASLDVHWSEGDNDAEKDDAVKLVVAAAPDVIFASGGTAARAARRATSTIPIVFAQVTDPVGGGLAASLSSPGGNATGFTQAEFGISGKWLELLREIAPGLTRVAVVRSPINPAAISQYAVIQSVAQAMRIEVVPANPADETDVSRVVADVARKGGGGLIVVTGLTEWHRHQKHVLSMAEQYRLPAVYPYGFIVKAGGLASYGADTIEPYRKAADYIHRIVMGEKPTELPVQASDQFELVINLKTAKALGLTVPPTLLARADEVIE